MASLRDVKQLLGLFMLTLQLHSHKDKHGKQSTIYQQSIFLQYWTSTACCISAAGTAGGCGQCWSTTACYCTTGPVIRPTYRLCMLRLLVLQLAFWIHRFYTGQSAQLYCYLLIINMINLH